MVHRGLGIDTPAFSARDARFDLQWLADRHGPAVVHGEFAGNASLVQQAREKRGRVVEQRRDDASVCVPRRSLARRTEFDFAAHLVAGAARHQVGRQGVGRARHGASIEMLDRRAVRGQSARSVVAYRVGAANEARVLFDLCREAIGFDGNEREQAVRALVGDQCVCEPPYRSRRVDLGPAVVAIVHAVIVPTWPGVEREVGFESMAARRATDDLSTRQRILAVAERLFAERGIGFVSVRDITTEARANIAAISYHFGSKDGLLEAIVVERAAQLGKRRNELLDAIEASPRPQLRDLVAALVVPMAELAADHDGGGQHWIRVKADLRGKPEMTSLLESAFEPYTRRYLEVLERVTPQLEPAVRVARFAVAKEAVELVFANDQLPGWVSRQVEFRADRLADIVIDFVTAGFASPLSTGETPAT